jgi:hypothetical protein
VLGLVGTVFAALAAASKVFGAQLKTLVGALVAAIPTHAVVAAYAVASARINAFVQARAEAQKQAAAKAEAAGKLRAWINGADRFRKQHDDLQFRAWARRSWE